MLDIGVVIPHLAQNNFSSPIGCKTEIRQKIYMNVSWNDWREVFIKVEKSSD